MEVADKKVPQRSLALIPVSMLTVGVKEMPGMLAAAANLFGADIH